MTTLTPLTPVTKGGLLWDAAALEARDSWRLELPDRIADEFLAYLARHPDITEEQFAWDPKELPALSRFGMKVRANLVGGDGVCLLRGLDRLGLDEEYRRVFFAAFGCAMGRPMLQYGRLYPVVDRGGSYTEQAIPVSMTNAPTGFHTDSSSRDAVPDFVGLLCEQPSVCGGDSLVSNALMVREVLRRESPESLALLERDWIRSVVTPGVERTRENLLRNRFPVFAPSRRPGATLFRYMRYWIEQGQEDAGRPAGDDVRAAFDRLDELLALPEHRVCFRLQSGDILWVNNRVIAHDRTGYRDEPGRERRLQRMWIEN